MKVVSNLKFSKHSKLKITNKYGKLKIKIDHIKYDYQNDFDFNDFLKFAKKIEAIHVLENEYSDRLINRSEPFELLKMNNIDLDNLQTGVYKVVNGNLKKNLFISDSGDVESDFKYLNIFENKKIFFKIRVVKKSGFESVKKMAVEKIEEYMD